MDAVPPRQAASGLKRTLNVAQEAMSYRIRGPWLSVPLGCRRVFQFLLFVCLAADSFVIMAMHLGGGVATVDGAEAINLSLQRNFQQHERQEHLQGNPESQQPAEEHNTSKDEQCGAMKHYFESINIPLPYNNNSSSNVVSSGKGNICGGNCCSNEMEAQMLRRAGEAYVERLQHRATVLQNILAGTLTLFQEQLSQLIEESEIATFKFHIKHRKQAPLLAQQAGKIYGQIYDHLKTQVASKITVAALEELINELFAIAFPEVYHQTVYSRNGTLTKMDNTFAQCLQQNFAKLDPYGQAPQRIFSSLQESIEKVATFLSTIAQSADLIGEAKDYYGAYITDTCQQQLFRMNYCPICQGLVPNELKVCRGFCINVLTGCSSEFAPMLDRSWSAVTETLKQNIKNNIQGEFGIISKLKHLGSIFFDSMVITKENQQNLEEKVKMLCGVPKHRHFSNSRRLTGTPPPAYIIWVLRNDAKLKYYYSLILKHKQFFGDFAKDTCLEKAETQHDEIKLDSGEESLIDRDDDFGRNSGAMDNNCWDGNQIGKYTKMVMASAADAQRYNPEIPLQHSYNATRLNEIADKLSKLHQPSAAVMFVNAYSSAEMFGDMAAPEGSSSHGKITINDDEEYGLGSGEGSGYGFYSHADSKSIPDVVLTNNIESTSRASSADAMTCYIWTTIAAVLYAYDSSNGIRWF